MAKAVCAIFVFFLVSNYTVGQMFPEPHLHNSDGRAGFGAQLVTPNALRAPAKARHAVDRAVKAITSNQPEEAEKQLGRALSLYPEYAEALTLRAIVEWKNDSPAAIADLERVIELAPSYGAAYAILASIYNDSQQCNNALVYAQKALHFLPRAWPVHYEMARALLGQHRSNEAIGEVSAAIADMSEDPHASAGSRATVHYLRAIILMDQRDFREARRELERTVKEEPTGTLATPSSQLLAQLGSNEDRQK